MSKWMPEDAEDARRMLKALEALLVNPVWVLELGPWLVDMAAAEAAAHEDASKLAQERAEHLWAMKRMREAVGKPEEFRDRIKRWLREKQQNGT